MSPPNRVELYHRRIARRVLLLVQTRAPMTFERVWLRRLSSPVTGSEAYVNVEGHHYVCDLQRRVAVVDLVSRKLIFQGQYSPQRDKESWWDAEWHTYTIDNKHCQNLLLPSLDRLLVLDDLSRV